MWYLKGFEMPVIRNSIYAKYLCNLVFSIKSWSPFHFSIFNDHVIPATIDA